MMLKHSKYLSIIVFVTIVYLIFLLVKPFIPVILGSLILAFAFHPLNRKLGLKIKKPFLTAAITTIIIFLIILLPLIFVLNAMAVESISAYQYIQGQDFSDLTSKFLDGKLTSNLQEIIDKVVSFFVQTSSKIVLSIPTLVLNIVLLFFLTYYFLKDGDSIVDIIKKHLPAKNKQIILNKFDRLSKALIYGTILVALIQGILGGIGFLIFDVPSPILWGTAMAITSFVPVIGTALIWMPAGILKLIQGNLVSGVGILLYGGIVISMADNFIRPYFVSTKAKVHPAIVLVGVLGGLNLFGFTGIIIGPLFLALALEFIGVGKATKS